MNKRKKGLIFLLISVMVLCTFMLSGCGKGKNQSVSDDYIKITENLYVHWINDIYTNTDEYIGKTIEIEGMYSMVPDFEVHEDKYYIFRIGPGCCANDGSMCGFEFRGKAPMNYKEQQWLRVKGTLKTYEQGSFTYLYLADCKVEKLKKPQKSIVEQ